MKRLEKLLLWCPFQQVCSVYEATPVFGVLKELQEGKWRDYAKLIEILIS
jgi:hypothetical protein